MTEYFYKRHLKLLAITMPTDYRACKPLKWPTMLCSLTVQSAQKCNKTTAINILTGALLNFIMQTFQRCFQCQNQYLCAPETNQFKKGTFPVKEVRRFRDGQEIFDQTSVEIRW